MDTCAETYHERRPVKIAVVGTSAILALLAGTAVYLLDRDWSSTLFLARFAGLQPSRTDLFGVLGGNLPSFFHAYALASLLIILLVGVRHARLVGSASWFATAAALECLQAGWLGDLVGSTAARLDMPLVVASIRAYIDNGQYDPGDLIAAALGCLAAWAVTFVLEDSS